MRTIFKILVMLIIFINSSYSQIPVTDVAASTAIGAGNALQTQNIAKNAGILAKAAATLKTLGDMKKQYDQWSENIEKVTSYIAYGKEVINIKNTISDVEDVYNSGVRLVKRSEFLTSNDKKRIIYGYVKILNDCISISYDTIDVVSDDKYKMNDAERLTFLKDAENQLTKKINILRYMSQKFEYAETRAAYNKSNNSIISSTPLYNN